MNDYKCKALTTFDIYLCQAHCVEVQDHCHQHAPFINSRVLRRYYENRTASYLEDRIEQVEVAPGNDCCYHHHPRLLEIEFIRKFFDVFYYCRYLLRLFLDIDIGIGVSSLSY